MIRGNRFIFLRMNEYIEFTNLKTSFIAVGFFARRLYVDNLILHIPQKTICKPLLDSLQEGYTCLILLIFLMEATLGQVKTGKSEIYLLSFV